MSSSIIPILNAGKKIASTIAVSKICEKAKNIMEARTMTNVKMFKKVLFKFVFKDLLNPMVSIFPPFTTKSRYFHGSRLIIYCQYTIEAIYMLCSPYVRHSRLYRQTE